MNEEAILRSRAPSWRRLQELTKRAGHSFRKLSDEELEEFVRLYRQASADLAFLTTRSSNESVVAYLNEVVAKAYGQLYREPYRPWGQKFNDALFMAATTVRRRWGALAMSVGVFVLGAVTAAALLGYSDEFRQFYIPEGEFGSVFDHWKTGQFEERTDGMNVASTFGYATNNPFVSILVNSFGLVTFGLMSTIVLWQNGAMVGALSYEMAGVGRLDYLWSSISPHGVTEIGGIFMAGAGGFVLAWALINPGRRSRGEALRVAGKDAFVFAVLSVLMTLLAAPIEGFFSFDPNVPGWLKTTVAMFTLFGWLAFFLGFGRNREAATEAT